MSINYIRISVLERSVIQKNVPTMFGKIGITELNSSWFVANAIVHITMIR